MDTSESARNQHGAGDAGPNWFRLPGWVQDVIAGVLIAAASCAPNPEGPSLAPAAIPATAVSVLVVALVLPWGRRFPLPVLGFTVAIAALAPLWTSSTFGFPIAAAIAMFRVASLTSRRTTLISGGAGMIILTVAAALSGPLGSEYARLLQPAVLLALAAAVGDASRHRRAYIAAITERAVNAERTRELEADRRVAEERLRIARELHDAAAHQIAAINLHAGVASNALPDRPEDAERSLEVIRDAARGVLGEISALLRILRSTPDEAGDSPAEPGVDLTHLDSLVDQFARDGLTVTTSVVGDPTRLPGALGIVAYKVLQEGMANALKHGSDARARVEVIVEGDQLTLSVTNQRAQSKHPELPSGQHGLIGVRERVELFRGSVSATEVGNDFILLATIPLSAASARERKNPMTIPITVLIVDDQALIRGAVRDLVAHEADMTVVGEAANGRLAVAAARELKPDVILMDIRMPEVDGIQATREIFALPELSGTRILILTTFEEDTYVAEALRAGASGFVGKATDPTDLMHAIRTIHDGEALLSPRATRSLIDRYVAGGRPADALAPRQSEVDLSELTERERAILVLVAEGWSNIEIAERLFISPLTAKTHVNRTMAKLRAHDRAQLVIIAYEAGLVVPRAR